MYVAVVAVIDVILLLLVMLLIAFAVTNVVAVAFVAFVAVASVAVASVAVASVAVASVAVASVAVASVAVSFVEETLQCHTEFNKAAEQLTKTFISRGYSESEIKIQIDKETCQDKNELLRYKDIPCILTSTLLHKIKDTQLLGGRKFRYTKLRIHNYWVVENLGTQN